MTGALVALLSEDVWVTTPPMPLEYQGRELAERFFSAVSFRPGRTMRIVSTRANRRLRRQRGIASGVVEVHDLQRALDNAVAGDVGPLVDLFHPDLEWRGPEHGHLWWRTTPA